MAFEFDFNETFKLCALYLSKGMRIIRLHGIRQNGRCTCGNPEHAVGKSAERSCGKHPVADNWGEAYARSEDDILAWDDGQPFNVGIVLGPDGGFIDIEDDTPEGKAFRESLGLNELPTPSYTSGRSTHQLMRFVESLNEISKAEPGGLECRIGGGRKQMQSVLPPSWHWSGVQYKWKPGQSIDEVDPVQPPRDLLVQIENYDGGKGVGGGLTQYQGPLVFRKVHDGEGRHRAMLLWAWDKIVNDRDPLNERRRSVLIKEIQDANEKYLVPPKSSSEVLSIVNSCFEHYRRKTESGWSPTPTDLSEAAVVSEAQAAGRAKAAPPVSGFEAHGLERYRIGEIDGYRPGDWSLQMIHGDPPEVVLVVPAWGKTPCKGRVHMTFDTFRSPAKVASAVFLATRRVILDGDVGKWVAVWKGIDASKKTGGVSVPGIMEQLLQRKGEEDDIHVGTSSLRYATLCGYLLQVFRKATKPRDEEKPEPNESGRPCWVTPDELWFQWAKVWEEIGNVHDVQAGERNKIRAKLIELVGRGKITDFPHKRHRFPSARMEYVVFSPAWVEALERLAAGEDEVDGDSPIDGGTDSVFEKIEFFGPSNRPGTLSPLAASS